MKILPLVVTWIFPLFLASCTRETVYDSASNAPGKEQAVVSGQGEGNYNDRVENDSDERELGIDLLPVAVKDAVAALFPGAELVEAEEVTDADGRMTYEVEVEINGETTEMWFDSQGNTLGTESDDDVTEDAEGED